MKVVISAGGTGGHIYPALAIIKTIKEKEKDSSFVYIGTDNRMEKDLIPEFGIHYEAIHVTGFNRKKLLKNFTTLKNFLQARKKCKKIIKEFNPDVVIGCGGYVTAPVIWAGKKLGKKTLIHEQNSIVGLSNRYLSHYASKIAISFEDTRNMFPQDKVVLTGNPCSEKALTIKKASKKEFNLTEDKKLVLIVMGSQGSSSVNNKIFSFIDAFKDKDYEVVFVTGNKYYEKIKNQKVPKNVKIYPFIYDMPRLMKNASLMVTRAGASTIAEVTVLGIPSFFIPSPYVPNNHQYKNAISLVSKKAGIILEEENLNKENLISLIDNTLKDDKKLKEIKTNLQALGIKDSSTRIYNVLKEMIDK